MFVQLTLSLSPAPSSNVTSYRVPLVESSFSPQLSSMDFQSVLADMEHIRILVLEESGGGGSGFLSNVQLSYAMLASGGSGVPGVELCNCPAEYQGILLCTIIIPGTLLHKVLTLAHNIS